MVDRQAKMACFRLDSADNHSEAPFTFSPSFHPSPALLTQPIHSLPSLRQLDTFAMTHAGV